MILRDEPNKVSGTFSGTRGILLGTRQNFSGITTLSGTPGKKGQVSKSLYQVPGKRGQASEHLFQVPGKKGQVSEPSKYVPRVP